MLLTQKRQHAHLTSGEKAVKVSEVTASGDRNAVSSVTSRDERGSLPLFLARHHPRTEQEPITPPKLVNLPDGESVRFWFTMCRG